MALIDINTIISTFNERGTLLKWLQKLEAALADSTLETVTVNTTPDGAGAQFVFNFSDDTHIETPYITLPRGATGATGKDGTNGADGVGISEITEGEAYVAGDQTITPVTIHLTEGNPVDLNIKATNGAAAAAGKDGVGISEITEGEAYVAGDQTITPVTVNLTEGEPVNLTVKAKNGTNGVDGTNGTNGTDGNGIVSVHALRHYTQGKEEITVVEVVTDDATNPQFEVHAQNGSGELYYHEVSLNLSGDSYFIKIGFYYQYNAQLTVQGIIEFFKYTTLPILEYTDDVGEYGITTGLSILETGVAFRIFTSFNTVSFIQINNISDISIDNYIIKKL